MRNVKQSSKIRRWSRNEICTSCSYTDLFVIRIGVSLYKCSRYHVGGAFCSAALFVVGVKNHYALVSLVLSLSGVVVVFAVPPLSSVPLPQI
jgi:hypothetical protein